VSPAHLFRLRYWPEAAALAAGGLTVLGFAPFALAPLAVLGPAVLFRLWLGVAPRRAFLLGWLYGVGLMGFGVFWIRVSIDQFGGVGTPLAVTIAVAFALAMALYYGLAGWAGARLAGVAAGPALLLVYPSIWVLAEWLRGWFLTGFPWLALGYSQIDAPLGGLAPWLGVYGVSLGVALSAGLLAYAATPAGRRRYAAAAGLAALWGVSAVAGRVEWGRPAGEPFRASVVQGNVEQELKWRPETLYPTLITYLELTEEAGDSRLVVWPETAVPAFADTVEEKLLRPLEAQSRDAGRDMLVGVPLLEGDDRYYNAMLALGTSGRADYRKRHLVPFGEFLPLEPLLRPLLDFLTIPMSDFSAGPRDRKPLLVLAGHPAGISICYEDAFAEEVRDALPEAAFLVNASNDAWFGDSLAPHQHLEIARMRSKETGRYLLRATNTGISAVIGPTGDLVAEAPLFERAVLSERVEPRAGSTPFVRVGNAGVLALAALGLLAGLLGRRSPRVGPASES
jgi:apolipoprotein N-acyltransferase